MVIKKLGTGNNAIWNLWGEVNNLLWGQVNNLFSKVPNPLGKTTHNVTHTHKKLDKVTRMLREAEKRGTVQETLRAIEKQRQSGKF